MLASVVAIVIAYAIGSVPVAHFAARWTAGVDLRERGSGNVGASNVWQSAARWLVVPVGLAQIGQGVAAVLVAVALDQGDGVRAACGIAAVVANDWNPWLRFEGGRGIGTTIGVLLVLAPIALGVFIVIAIAGVAAAGGAAGRRARAAVDAVRCDRIERAGIDRRGVRSTGGDRVREAAARERAAGLVGAARCVVEPVALRPGCARSGSVGAARRG